MRQGHAFTFRTKLSQWLLVLFCTCFHFGANAQQGILVNLAAIDGVPITPDNIFNFMVQSTFTRTTNVQVKGTIRYRNSPMSISYSFNYTLRPGMNMVGNTQVQPQWQFSSSVLQDLFFNYKLLPDGTYEYCVSVVPTNVTSGDASANGASDECLYHKADDLFLINLAEPDNNAKIYEFNPMLSWIANCSFASMLTYRISVAPILQGQNPENAIMRNNPVYDERNLPQNSIIYPVYAKPLVANQPYAWKVDAYYKGVLLGGSEIWKFTIIADSLFSGIGNSSYIDIRREQGKTTLYAPGSIKLKYTLDEAKIDTLYLRLLEKGTNTIPLKNEKLAAKYGDNRYEINFKESNNLKHQTAYTLIIKTMDGVQYTLPFTYINPDFTH